MKARPVAKRHECLYSTIVEDNFQISDVQITGKCICQSTTEYTPNMKLFRNFLPDHPYAPLF